MVFEIEFHAGELVKEETKGVCWLALNDFKLSLLIIIFFNAFILVHTLLKELGFKKNFFELCVVAVLLLPKVFDHSLGEI